MTLNIVISLEPKLTPPYPDQLFYFIVLKILPTITCFMRVWAGMCHSAGVQVRGCFSFPCLASRG